ncbi:MAG TPA: sarcosine oxidase subunit alpha family protein [Roseiarcus sp.]|nr:sarcosine oxidase subunit alpha family protein [Roseiarcus sp.]
MSAGINRLKAGGLISRQAPLAFRFDGRRYGGFDGDTLASALLANGVRLVGRSFKYHRPRGLLTAGPEEPNGLVELRSGAWREPNTRATTIELYEGLEAASQNRFPSLAFDFGAINSLAAPLLTAGFYYKTFMRPAALWERLYEPLIRRAAGLGRASREADPDSYEKAFAFCDTLVIGGGPAGLAAALAAGRAGARVILADDDFRLGGRLNAERCEVDGRSGVEWAEAAGRELAALPNVRIFKRTTVFGVYDGGVYGALERVSDHLPVPPPYQPRQRLWRIYAKRAVLASGAIERPIAFPNNDRPGVMMASAVRAYLNRFAVLCGRKAAIFTCADDGWRAAADLSARDVEVVAVVDARREVAPPVLAQAGRTRIFLGGAITSARGRSVRGADILDGDGRRVSIDADLIAICGGYNPQIGLTTHLGGKPAWRDDISAFVPGDTPLGLVVAGAANGAFALHDAIRQGWRAGETVADRRTAIGVPPRADDEPIAVKAFWRVGGLKGKAFVDFQNDVTTNDIAVAAREGYRSVEHLKRYTTLGMATDQGKTSNVVGLAILAELTGRTISETGATRLRPPHTPVAIAAFAGPHRGKAFRPTRLTPGHDWAAERGAAFVEAGPWLRAQYFPLAGEDDWLQSTIREVRGVRERVGICDVSTLGKIELTGPDVGALLDRIYANTFSTLPVGRVRYGLMLREDGFVMDDGTTMRLAPDRWLMSTTTANAAKVTQHLEFCLQALWPELDVALASVTDRWAQYSVAGPRSRALLQKLLGGAMDISNATFPHMAARESDALGTRIRLARLSFSGELAYEIASPADCGDALVRSLMEAGREFDAAPYGVEALSVMRIEKGHVAGGELSGHTTARDLGLGRLMSTKKDFIGCNLSQRPALLDPDRPTLVGLKPADRRSRLRAGAHVLALGAASLAENDQGYVTSAAFSEALGHWIALALIKRGPERLGERMRAYDPVRGGDVEVELARPVFIDPEGARLHA